MLYFGVLVLGFAAGWLLSGLNSRMNNQKVVNDEVALVYDGNSLQLQKAQYKDGVLTVNGTRWTGPYFMRASDFDNVGLRVYLVSAQPYALYEHVQLEKMRQGLVLSSMFRNGGDMAKTLRNGASVAFIACALYVASQVGGLNASLVEQRSLIQNMKDTLDKPLVVSK